MWELPLTLGWSRRPFRLWRRCYEAIERSWLSRLRLIGIAERLGLVRKVWLNFEIGDERDWTGFLKLIRRLRLPCICFTVHSSSLSAGPGPYTRTKRDEDRIFSQIERVFTAIGALPGFVPATASQVAQYLELEHASARN